jgi:hypothetical protein
MKRLVLAFKFGFKFPVGGSVPVLFSSMVNHGINMQVRFWRGSVPVIFVSMEKIPYAKLTSVCKYSVVIRL